MKQSLQLKLGQHLTMTPQLQQAIRLLQLSTLELQQEIQEALDSNPLLEFIEPGYAGGDQPSEDGGSGAAAEAGSSADEGGATDAEAGGSSDLIPSELPVDTS